MTATKQRIATIRGTFAVPGVSKNRRFYSKTAIAGAVTEAQELIASGNAPVVAMLTHHGARDPKSGDVTRTAGHVTKVGLSPEGHGTFEADIADTQAGRDVAALTTPTKPYLKGVSIAAMWKGTPRTVMAPDGAPAETADGFSLKGIDFTHSPGVDGAEITSAELTEAASAGLFFESIQEATLMESAIQPAPTGVVEAMTRVFKTHGISPPVLRTLAKSCHIAEADVARVAVAWETARTSTAKEIREAGETTEFQRHGALVVGRPSQASTRDRAQTSGGRRRGQTNHHRHDPRARGPRRGVGLTVMFWGAAGARARRSSTFLPPRPAALLPAGGTGFPPALERVLPPCRRQTSSKAA